MRGAITIRAFDREAILCPEWRLGLRARVLRFAGVADRLAAMRRFRHV